MKTDNAMEAMKHLLMRYDNDRKHIYGEINTLLNTSSSFDIKHLIGVIDDAAYRAALVEQKYAIVYNLITQAMSQLNSDKEAQKTEDQP